MSADYDLEYYKNNWDKYHNFDQVLLCKDTTLEAIKFNIDCVNNIDQIRALVKKEVLSAQENYPAFMDKATEHQVLTLMVANDKKIQNFYKEIETLEHTIAEWEKKFKEQLSKKSITEKDFERMKSLFIFFDEQLFSPCLATGSHLPLLVKLTFAQLYISVHTINLEAQRSWIEFLQSCQEKNKKRVEELNKAIFDEAMRWLSRVESVAHYTKVLNQYIHMYEKLDTEHDEIIKKLALLPKPEDDQKIEIEWLRLHAYLREAHNKKKLAQEIMVEIEKRKTACEAKNKRQENSFNDYLRLLGYI